MAKKQQQKQLQTNKIHFKQEKLEMLEANVSIV